jgi:hypothetical protein
MGKASRRKRSPRLDGLAADASVIVDPTHQRSALVACLRESVWAEGNPSSSENALTSRASRIMLTHPELRVVRFPLAQSDAFRSYGEDLFAAASNGRPPFAHTFYDFGFLPLGKYLLAGAVAFAHDPDPDVRGSARWRAIAYMRIAGTDDWTTMVITGAPASGSGPRHMHIGPIEGRPPADSATAAARLIVAGAIVFLESANVELVDSVALPRGHQAHGVPHYEVVVRQATKRHVYGEDHQPVAQEWSHRWEVRGHFKHFRKGPTFDKNADRQITTADGDRYVRIWCPPHVKGPADKPLLPKVRRVAATS